MRHLATLILITSFSHHVFCQDLPNLEDSVLIFHDITFPFYRTSVDSNCAEELFYDDGSVKATGSCENGKKSGTWTSFYKSGDTMSSGTMFNDSLVGEWCFYFPNGRLRAKGSFEGGTFELGCAGSGNYISVSIKSGNWQYWSLSGSKILTCNYVKNEYGEQSLNGRYTKWYDSGQKLEEGSYKNGMKNGKWTYWYVNGQKQREEYFVYQDCLLYDYVWYECPTGEWKYWNEDGTIDKVEKYKNGIKTLN